MLVFSAVVIYGGQLDAGVAADGFEFAEEDDAGGGVFQLLDGVFVGAEGVATVNEGLLRGDWSQGVGPIDGAIPPTDMEMTGWPRQMVGYIEGRGRQGRRRGLW